MESRTCQNCNNDFTLVADELGFYEKIGVPAPTFCPECRSLRRQIWRNVLSLYSRKCDLCQKPVISCYSPSVPIVQYCNKCWWSDEWDPKASGRDYDFSRPFFEQFQELMHSVPHIAVVNDNGIASLNCEYTFDWWFSKNCYMCFDGWKVENVMYAFFGCAGKYMVDVVSIRDKNEWLYECIDCERSYQIKYSQFAVACSDSQFLYDCRSCQDCFMCSGLRNKRYCFKNVEYSKEEYEQILASYRLDTWEGSERARKEFEEFITSYPRRFARIIQSAYSSGDLLLNCKNVHHGYNLDGAENCRYYDYGSGPKDSQDLSMSGELSECYEGNVVDHSSRNFFGLFTVKSQDVQYTQHCHSGKYLFGCIGLRSSQYCILNKEYTKEEYEELMPKIIEHMNAMPYVDKRGRVYKYGEFFPSDLSPHGYNETAAHQSTPLTRDEAIALGYSWQDNLQMTTGKETLAAEQIPETIAETTDAITNEILACIDCGRNYKIVAQEMVFYRKMNIPVPHRCFYCRHAARMARRNPFKLWHRECMCELDTHGHSGKCSNEFETSYAPERPETVFCEGCYQSEVN
jgi:hypothetical protein